MRLDDSITTNKSSKVLGLDVPVQSDDSVTGRTGFTEQSYTSYEQRDALTGETIPSQYDDAANFDPAHG